MSRDWKEKAFARQEEYLNKLVPLLAINSIEDLTTAAEGKPFGEGVAQALEYFLKLGEADGFRTKNLDGYAGYVEYGEGEEEVGVLVHVDVVTVGEGWTTPPFEPSIRDGKIYARGAIDDKGPALAAYYALKLVKESGLPLSKRIRFIIGTDEESGWLCMKHYAEVEKLPEIGFSPDASFPMIHAEKGQINPTLAVAPYQSQADSTAWVLHSFASGDQGNSVPEKVKAIVSMPLAAEARSTIQEIRESWQAHLARHGVTGEIQQQSDGTLCFEAKGKPAHGMEPHLGKNAGTIAAHFLHQFSFQGSDQAFLGFLSEVLHEDHWGEKLGLAVEDEVTGRLTVNAGIFSYDRAEGGSIRLNIRYPATIEPEEYVEKLKKRADELNLGISSLRTSRAHYVPKDHPVVQTLSRVYSKHTGEEAVLLSSGGATYAKSLKAGVAFGPLFPGKKSMAHLTDEYAEIDDLLRAIAIYAEAMYELAK
ncbi:dipeptidase PepV [Brevibacillus ruminantium]|uniref:Dipeptidase PepV n=1 Tax=Brevibacillus ruminantium TaxID=2950604 RepID=A0ABY4WBH7_9BACL|nr:dipeptidase PepV [Brevibacillus ruminantium]USG64186.1 dipeptidase PepV [Brevibacillus ruminantium]